MPKQKKEKKSSANQQPSFQNDQLGENAAEHFSDEYNNKRNKKRKQ
ncbi:MAG TPA: hypothetical protein GX505_12280 [Clostridiales bacterium]|nr:hypothetical protein [Clostridiales bacterium]